MRSKQDEEKLGLKTPEKISIQLAARAEQPRTNRKGIYNVLQSVNLEVKQRGKSLHFSDLQNEDEKRNTKKDYDLLRRFERVKGRYGNEVKSSKFDPKQHTEKELNNELIRRVMQVNFIPMTLDGKIHQEPERVKDPASQP